MPCYVIVIPELSDENVAFRESLAGSLKLLGIRLTALGDFEAVFSADREAVALYGALLPLDPVRYRASLEQAVTNFAIDLRDLAYSEQEIADQLAGLSLPDAD